MIITYFTHIIKKIKVNKISYILTYPILGG